jgi:hypothetical protein
MMFLMLLSGLVDAAVVGSEGKNMTSIATATTRTVEWWLGSYTPSYFAENSDFIHQHRTTITGVLHCCRGVRCSFSDRSRRILIGYHTCSSLEELLHACDPIACISAVHYRFTL